jgi:hypothetical protein
MHCPHTPAPESPAPASPPPSTASHVKLGMFWHWLHEGPPGGHQAHVSPIFEHGPPHFGMPGQPGSPPSPPGPVVDSHVHFASSNVYPATQSATLKGHASACAPSDLPPSPEPPPEPEHPASTARHATKVATKLGG